MEHPFSHRQRVEFYETDMAGIVHFSNFFRYMEITESAFFRSLGLSLDPADVAVGWPRVNAQCDYRAPLRYNDTWTCALTVTAITARSISYRFDFRRAADPDTDADAVTSATAPLAVGRLTIVCVQLDPATGKMAAVPIPPLIRDRLPAPIPPAEPTPPTRSAG